MNGGLGKIFARCNIGLLKETGSRYNSWSTLNGGILVFKSFPGPSNQSDDVTMNEGPFVRTFWSLSHFLS